MTAVSGLDQTTDAPETPSAPAVERRFLRSRTNRVLAGVCGGIAEYYGSDVTAVRILAVVIAVSTGILPLLFLYLIAAVLVPERLDGTAPTATGQPPASRRRLGVPVSSLGCSSSRSASSRLRTRSCSSTGTSCGRSRWSPSGAASSSRHIGDDGVPGRRGRHTGCSSSGPVRAVLRSRMT